MSGCTLPLPPALGEETVPSRPVASKVLVIEDNEPMRKLLEIYLVAGNFLQKPCHPADLKRKLAELERSVLLAANETEPTATPEGSLLSL